MKQTFAPILVAVAEGTQIPLEKPIVLIGRHQECDIQIPSRKISRRHCCIALVADHLVIRDLGSTNGIRINGVKVLEGNLKADDEVTIGNVRYQVKWVEPKKSGVKIKIEPGNQPVDDVSLDVPMPLPDVAMPHLALGARPDESDETQKPS